MLENHYWWLVGFTFCWSISRLMLIGLGINFCWWIWRVWWLWRFPVISSHSLRWVRISLHLRLIVWLLRIVIFHQLFISSQSILLLIVVLPIFKFFFVIWLLSKFWSLLQCIEISSFCFSIFPLWTYAWSS